MKQFASAIFCLLILCISSGLSRADPAVLSQDEIEATLSFGPWPPVFERDPSNKVSGNINAVRLGRKMFFSPKFSGSGTTSCATCHEPENGFTERKPRAELASRTDRNTQSLLNVRLHRWFGWDGSHDNLWAQSFAPLLKSNEMDLPPKQLSQVLKTDAFRSEYEPLFGSVENHSQDMMFVNVGKTLAAYVETLNTDKSPFDYFRDALADNDALGIAKYPMDAKRGLKIFLGKGNCTFCHSGPLFSNGEFHDAGVPYFVEAGRVDAGRHVGVKNLKSNPFTLAGSFSDDPQKKGAWKVQRVVKKHSDFGTFRVPSLRNVERTAPYMHDGSLATLRDVVNHYSNIDLERMHADGEVILNPLKLTDQETDDLIAFLKSLTAPDPKF